MYMYVLSLSLCCQGGAAPLCAAIITGNNVDKNLVYAYILIMVALFVFFRLVGAAILVQKAKRFY